MNLNTQYHIAVADPQLREQIHAVLPRSALLEPRQLAQFRQRSIIVEYHPKIEEEIIMALRRANCLLLFAKHEHFDAIHDLSTQYPLLFNFYDQPSCPGELSLALHQFMNMATKWQEARRALSDMEENLFHVAIASTNFMEKNERMEELICRDSMTHLHNQMFFKNALRERLEKQDCTSSIVILDLDHFKSVNDRFGHLKGDEVIQTFADCIREVIGKRHITARYGGEEFAFLLNRMPCHRALKLLAKLRERFTAISFQSPEQTFHVNFSSGLVALSSKFTTMNDALKAADEALYTSKKSGRACDTCTE